MNKNFYVHFYEHPARRDFDLVMSEPLPSEFDIPVPPKWSLSERPDNSRPSRMLVRRFRLEYFHGEPRYVWTGWAER